MIAIKKQSGLIVAPFTPMNTDGSLNVSIIPKYYEFLKRNHVQGVFINGSTGEGVSLSVEEKKMMQESWGTCTKNDANFFTMAFLGGTSVTEARHLAIHAESVGLNSVSFTSPYYFKPPHVKALAETCSAVASAVPHLPFYYYHIPVLTGGNFSMLEFLQCLDGVLPNLAGVKYTHEDLMDFQSCIPFAKGKYQMFWGRDENFLAGLAVGSIAAVGSTYNYMAPVYHQITEAFHKNDFIEARRLQQISIDLIRLLGKYGGIATGKAYMKLLGLDMGEFRLPVKNMNQEAFQKFSEEANSIGFQQYKSIL